MQKKPTDGELEILRILWQEGASTVREINDALNQERAVGYTTTLKLMQIMHDKGFLTRVKEGKTHIYQAAIEERATQRQLVDRLLDTAFQGSALKLVMQALGSRTSSQEEIDAIRQYLDELSQSSDESAS